MEISEKNLKLLFRVECTAVNRLIEATQLTEVQENYKHYSAIVHMIDKLLVQSTVVLQKLPTVRGSWL